MAQPQVIEGTPRELAAFLGRLPDARYRITFSQVEEAVPQWNVDEKAMEALRLLEARHKGRRATDSSNTARLLREARSGGAYGYEPTE